MGFVRWVSGDDPTQLILSMLVEIAVGWMKFALRDNVPILVEVYHDPHVLEFTFGRVVLMRGSEDAR